MASTPPRRSARQRKAPVFYSPDETPEDDYSHSDYDSDVPDGVEVLDELDEPEDLDGSDGSSEDSTSADESFIDDEIVYESDATSTEEELEIGSDDSDAESCSPATP